MRHWVERNAPLGRDAHKFTQELSIENYTVAAAIVSAVISKGTNIDQPTRGNPAFTFESKVPIGVNGERKITVTTRLLNEIKDPILRSQVIEQLVADNLVPPNPTAKDLENVQVVMTIAPDDGSMIDDDAVEVGKSDENEEGPSVDDGGR